ncbi:lipoprotein LpqV [Mycobacterium sp.]|uniref:lipoprotein LpqV n=1 Tax=Mycobacterium sp. TaxID=1785 RepID=UPI0031E2A816
MWRRPVAPLPAGTVTALTLAAAAAACSAHGSKAPPITPSGTTRAAATTTPGVVFRSPAGVTTKIDVPAHSTEEEYFQACHAATVWMQAHPGDRRTLTERYLAAVQTPGVVGPGTWNIAWAALPMARQAGVIVAAQAAAGGECG